MKGFKLLCIGDSLTEGYDIDLEKCWVSLLKERKGWDVTNAGISGDMTAGMLARLPLALEKENYSHVFIMGGTNDVEFGLSPNHIVSNIKAIMRQLRHLEIPYTIGIPIPFDNGISTLTHFEYVENGEEYRKKIDEYCDELKSFLEYDEADFIDFRDFFKNGKDGILSDLFLEDGVHPNCKGHDLICRIVFEHLENRI